MATKEDRLCDICSFQDITEQAVEWCPECDEFLCSKCKVHHSIGKATRNHKTVRVENYSQLPSDILTLKQTCDEHDGQIEFYCSDHELLCCVKCTREAHRECKSVDSLQDVVQNVKSSSSFTDVEESVDDLCKNIDEINDECRKNNETLEKSEEKCRTEIENFKISLNSRLDELKAKLLNELETKIVEKKVGANEMAQLIGSKKDEIWQIKENLEKVKSYASNIQAFLYLRNLTKTIMEKETELEALLTKPELQTAEFTFTPSAGLSTLLSAFGRLNINTKPISYSIQRQKTKQAQLFASPGKAVTNSTIQKKLDIVFPNATRKICIRDCIAIPSGELLFADRNNKCLLVCTNDGVYKDQILLSAEPFGLAFIREDRVAVTLLNNKFCIVDVMKKTTLSEFELDETPNGIQIHGLNLLVNIYEFGYYIVGPSSGKIIKKIPIGNEKMPYFVLQNSKIYCAKWEQDKVVCYDLFGGIQWEYTHDKLRGPNGISIDENGDLYVVCFKSNHLFIITADGQSGKEVLADLVSPINVYYNKHSRSIVVCCNSHATIYKLN